MSITLGIVEVLSRSTAAAVSDQLVTSLACRRFAGKSLLEWVIRRVTESLLLDQVAVVTDCGQQDSLLRLTPADVSVFAGRQADPLGRIAAASRKFNATQLVRVTIDSPFVDPQLIDRLICTANAHPGCDYIGYRSNDGLPAVQSNLGLFAEWCRSEAIYRADEEAVAVLERQDATRYLYTHPELFRLRLIPVPPQLDRDDVRLAIDVEEDWDHAQIIYEALGPDSLDWQTIAGLLDQQPGLRQRMAVLNRAPGSSLREA